MNFLPNRSSALQDNIMLRHRLTRKIKIRAAHEVMAARTTELALLVDQFVPALRTISPMFAGNVFVGRRGAGVLMKIVRRN
jgi:membrane protein DedA with SNARE-associated domain